MNEKSSVFFISKDPETGVSSGNTDVIFLINPAFHQMYAKSTQII